MITKAISWVLRSLVKHHRSEVENYLDTHEESLPRIAVREVRVKLDTGRKTQR
jgi:3-methyladenine DNA glycosylase AlkD